LTLLKTRDRKELKGEKIMLCSQCEERPIAYKKSNLCTACYQKNRKKRVGSISVSERQFSTQPREILFIKNYFRHSNWLYHPITFNFSDFSYTPDFFDLDRQTFIEVVGTRQAFHQNKNQYIMVKQTFPCFSFEIRDVLGGLVDISVDGSRITWPNGTPNNLSSPITSESEAVGG
jgi:hypothetical protein